MTSYNFCFKEPPLHTHVHSTSLHTHFVATAFRAQKQNDAEAQDQYHHTQSSRVAPPQSKRGQRDGSAVQFLALTWWHTTIFNSSSRRANTLPWSLQALGTHVGHRQHTHTHTKHNKNKKKHLFCSPSLVSQIIKERKAQRLGKGSKASSHPVTKMVKSSP